MPLFFCRGVAYVLPGFLLLKEGIGEGASLWALFWLCALEVFAHFMQGRAYGAVHSRRGIKVVGVVGVASWWFSAIWSFFIRLMQYIHLLLLVISLSGSVCGM